MPKPASPLFAILLLSATIKLAYVLGMTDFRNYVVSDPAHYFTRALALAQGASLGPVDWQVFPLGSSVLLALYLRALAVVGLGGDPLVAALVLNVIASTAGVYVLWRIAEQMQLGPRLRLAMVASYALFYPLVYLNAFTLSEGPAQWFFMASLLALLKAEGAARPARRLIASGLLWALAVHCRSSFLLAGPVAVLFIGMTTSGARNRLRCTVQFAGAAAVPFLLVGAVLHASSDGAIRSGTGQNGGMNFFMQQCFVHGARSSSEQGAWVFVPPLTAQHPELGLFETRVPFSQQGYFYRAGWDCLRSDPDSLKRLAAIGPTLLYGNFMPSWYSAYGFKQALPISQHMSVFLLLLSPLGISVLMRRRAAATALLLLNGLALGATFVAFNADHRHLYSLSYLYFLFGFVGAVELLRGGLKAGLRYGAAATVVVLLLTWALRPLGPWNLYAARDLHTGPARLQAHVDPGSAWNCLACLRFRAALSVHWPKPQSGVITLRLLLDHNDDSQLTLLADGRVLLQQDVAASPGFGLREVRLGLADTPAAGGFDQLRIRPIRGDGRYSAASLVLVRDEPTKAQ